MKETPYDKGYEQGYAEAMEAVRKTKITPTKEQIDEVTSLACMKHKGYSDCCECVLASVGECDLVWLPAFAEAIITEWEKIRNSPN